MSATKNQILRLRIIDELLARKSWVKSAVMKKAIEEQLLEEVSIRTIQNDIRDLKEDTRLNYYAPIEYDNKNKAYRYTQDDYSIKNFGLQENEISAFIFYANCLGIFSEYSLFSDFSNGLKKIIEGVKAGSKIADRRNVNKILQSDSLIVAKGQEFLGDIIYAIDKMYKLSVSYKGFEQERASKRVLYPYYIKEYKNRWYLLAVKEKEDKVKIYAFDRMRSVEVLEEVYLKPTPFDAPVFFKHSFGITAPNGNVQEVILRFDKKEMPYILSLPIHPTQRIKKETKKFTDISLRVYDSYELREFIISKTPRVKVISPEYLKEAILQDLIAGQKKYL